ncbi:TPA: hypothetical protein HA335_04545 [Methanocaldococcus jannaschii]|uniref:Uncharacterized protein MJ1356 n=2 Tax=Methanocaldococcus jannaschii TaxID=2190 RepID=Y1356_METJA|nr:protoglobin domain-containing protein [Methanocaldococcus jannaschii]Q58751.1 RecName: Full=Uncharacterized protein MJ1356 [Methanocaldococcus jannaschii DSM 2661]AAB99367.1 hypothetical protein MJ_1356 [Methanocaldococcus jannaschii DSM 2661]HII59829.1 hypothetical protein [Methanocaldococcus jannaschii]
MNVTFDGIYNEIIENMHHFASEEKDFSKLTQYKDLISKTIDEVVEEVFNDIFSYEKTKTLFDESKRKELEEDFKNWIKGLFEISNDSDLNEFYKEIVKRGIKYVEKDFLPEYLTAIIIKIEDRLKNKLKEELKEDAQEIVDILDDLLKRVILLNVAAYMNFESKVLDYIGINQNLKKNAVKLGIKKMGL